ncbi:type 4a pilus biogenesis protein PilO [Haliangium ochraceum]|uniref:Uncharacterized protein n=1 Tax=Haliangium ochraceum (strain DSM 14365 / JCM 11303 / SMP-2) TaxID=502025 RepID=D0LHM9_HALO1|nr:type 4a pilus biogenesis protein PilO [Haliangium ochraceum]ACY12891.1 hypothetical protein Hoch_0250 [Haliangium ochraceum DSM 14365]
MADRSFLDEVTKWTPRQKAAFVLLPPFLIGLLYAFGPLPFSYQETQDELVQKGSERNRLLGEQAQLDRDLETKKQLLQRMEELEQSIRANERALPTDAELPAFFDFLQRRASEAGVSIRKWDQMSSEKLGIYVRVPVKIEVSGTFLNLVRYFYLLGPVSDVDRSRNEALSLGERIVSVEELTLDDAELVDREVVLTAYFIAATFYLDEQAQQAGQQAGAQK